MSDLNSPPTLPARSGFPRKVVILFLLILDTAIGIYFLFRWKPGLHILVRQVFADLTLGLSAGFGARILFRRRNWFIRYIAAVAGLITGLLSLGLLTGWQMGFGPLYFWRNNVDWAGLGQILFSMISMGLAMRAWPRTVQPAVIVPQVVPVAPALAPPDVHTRPRPKRKRGKRPQSIASTGRPDIFGKSFSTRKRGTRIEKQPLQGLSLRKPRVRLSQVEKHLCPYCLEPVLKQDPRGVVECEICHTLHHADCWAIAGACQVPHYTA